VVNDLGWARTRTSFAASASTAAWATQQGWTGLSQKGCSARVYSELSSAGISLRGMSDEPAKNRDVSDAWAKHREWLLSTQLAATQDFDKTLVTLAGGALGISIAFINKVAPHPQHKWVLGMSWGLLALSLLLILSSFMASERAHIQMIQRIDEDVDEVERGTLTAALNWLALASFVLGVGFLVAFALNNFGN
jgi:hypothetical protein